MSNASSPTGSVDCVGVLCTVGVLSPPPPSLQAAGPSSDPSPPPPPPPPNDSSSSPSPPSNSNSSAPPPSASTSSNVSPPSPSADSNSSPPPPPPTPSSDSNSSPPPPTPSPDVNSSPPPPTPSPDLSSSPPPPSSDSNLSPPSISESPPPPSPVLPPPDSSSSQSPPPSVSSPPPPSVSSPPPPSSSSQPPPDSSATASPPPPPPPASKHSSPGTAPKSSPRPPHSPPAQSPPPPASHGSPPPPNADTPLQTASAPPPADTHLTTPPSQTTLSPPTPPTLNYNPPSESTPSQPSAATPALSRAPSTSETQFPIGTIAGSVIGVVVISLFAMFFVISRRRKRRDQAFAIHYRFPPNGIPLKTDQYSYGAQHSIAIPGQSYGYYTGNLPTSSTNSENGYGSNIGNVLTSGRTDSGGFKGSKLLFDYEEMIKITDGFPRENILGEGGFGTVYKGWMPDGKVVAVKQLKVSTGQGEQEFRAEVEVISRVHHRHLVSLVGCCIAEQHRLLVFEFVPNNTLEYHLHGPGRPVMEWSKRVKIAIGAARGLAYLHEDCHPKIIHRDIKSANILLDATYEAQVADFGMAKLSTDTNTHVYTRVMGTFGYMAPEYASSGKLTDRSDVFSFGVVLLEIITGRKPVDQSLGHDSLVEWARPLLNQALETGDFSELADPRLEQRYIESEMLQMVEAAAACIRHSAPKRPRMVQVLRALDTDGDTQDLSNGVKYGQSTIFEVNKNNSEMQRFRKLAFSNDESCEYQMYSGERSSREVPRKPRIPWSGESTSSEFQSSDSETCAINPRGN